uniref:Uncharacterized protein n=1 Tax=Meloidogyne incognita TaxID=6306 RepID=A0A914KGN5_MELIC
MPPSIYNNNLNIRRIFIFLQLRLFQLLFVVNISLFILQTPLILTSINEKIKNKNQQLINNKENNIFINSTKFKNKFSRSVRLLDKNEREIKKYPLIVAAGEKLNIPIKGGTVPIEWFNLRIVDPQRFGRRLGDLRFEVLKNPKHGKLQFLDNTNLEVSSNSNSRENSISSFFYADILNKKVLYKHFGDSSKNDKFKLGVDTRRFSRRAGGGGRLSKTENGNWVTSNSEQFDLEVNVEQQNENINGGRETPKILIEPIGEAIHLKIGKRLQLGPQHLRIYDPDTPNDRVWVNVEEISSNSLDLIDKLGARLRRFSLSGFLKGNVHLIVLENYEEENEDDKNEKMKNEGFITFLTRDDFGASEPATIHVFFVPLQVVFDQNTGIRMIHHSSHSIEPTQLHSHCTSDFSLSWIPTARYSIVDQPNFGVVECLREDIENKEINKNKKWIVCSTFTQNEINSLKVRYRHTKNSNIPLPPRTDDFDFQVYCSNTASLVQVLQIDFITLSIRVFVQEQLTLNQTDQAQIGRKNMLATVFPQQFSSDQLYFHILEAPKLGMLLRLVQETGRHRRVGVSSNITQQQIDEGLFFYKLHFAPFSVLNDFFTFRLLTPAGASEEIFRFDIVYLPGGGIGDIRLRNNTLIVEEGGIQELTNGTLWLEAADGSRRFTFRVILPPMNGILFLLDKNGNKEKKILDFDDNFHSDNILENKLFYEHFGDKSGWDRLFLLAESEMRDPGGGKGHTPVPFFLSIAIVGKNTRQPQLLQKMYGGNNLEIKNLFLLENSERTLLPSIVQLIDLDNSIGWPSSLENYKQFPIAHSTNSLNFNVVPEPSNSRDFVICAKGAPEMPLREFDENMLKGGHLIVRHVGSAINGTILRLTATDGLHTKTLPISIFAVPKPFLRLSTPNKIYFNTNFNERKESSLFLLVSILHLFAETNLDIFDYQIIFQVQTILPNLSPFRLLLENGTFVKTLEFTQKVIVFFKKFNFETFLV